MYTYKVLVGNMKGRNQETTSKKYAGIEERIILIWILRKNCA
jgi:hypothetical protein